MWWIVIAVLILIALAIDWIIVIGTNPKSGKGEKKDD